MRIVLLVITMSAALVCALSATSARAALFEFSASGTIGSSNEATIPVGTPWTMDLIYDTDAPDHDFESTGSPDQTFGLFTNTGTPPALIFFHYQAGSYAATVHDPAAFGAFSNVVITFTSVHAIDINIRAPDSFPSLSGDVFFHADFNDFSSRPIFTSDGLPTNPALGPGSFDQSTVSLFTNSPRVFVGGSTLASLKVTPLPEPSSSSLTIAGLLGLLGTARRRAHLLAHSRWMAAVAASRFHDSSPSRACIGTRKPRRQGGSV
jgi:hypothetical protein